MLTVCNMYRFLLRHGQVSSTAASGNVLSITDSAATYTGNLIAGTTGAAAGTGYNLLSLSTGGSPLFAVRHSITTMRIVRRNFGCIAWNCEDAGLLISEVCCRCVLLMLSGER